MVVTKGQTDRQNEQGINSTYVTGKLYLTKRRGLIIIACFLSFLADCTIGRAVGTQCSLSVVCDVLSEGMNRKPGSKSWFWGCRHISTSGFASTAAVFCLIFARTAQRWVQDGTNGFFSSKACKYCRIAWSELKPEVVLATIIDPERCK